MVGVNGYGQVTWIGARCGRPGGGWNLPARRGPGPRLKRTGPVDLACLCPPLSLGLNWRSRALGPRSRGKSPPAKTC